ncbi:hypothetical protein [Neisseria animaloris]|uniref:hypothetical protein n=1 Tax=Neisseria animaloris TaxID=326522 RepID=UPI0039E1F598
MAKRSADATILGYLYQFDFSIRKILESNIDDEIELEGVEDIDIISNQSTNLFQCKYYEATEYNHSVIKDAITAMFKHFLEHQAQEIQNFKYYLYGHFNKGQEKYSNNFEILKKSLLHKEEIENIPDEIIESFHQKLVVDVNTLDFEGQKIMLINELKKSFAGINQDRFIECVYLSNARNIIASISSKKDERKISKKLFLEELRNRENVIIDSFLLFERDKNKYARTVKQKIEKIVMLPGAVNRQTNTYFLVIDVQNDEVIAKTIPNFSRLIFNIHAQFSSKYKAVNNFFPYFVFPNLSGDLLVKIKNELYNQGNFILDGTLFLGAKKNFQLEDERFNNDLFRPFKILSTLEEIQKVCQNNNLMRPHFFDFYRVNCNSIDQEMVKFHFQQNSINTLEAIFL